MATLRRMLKYMPVVALALVLAAWSMSAVASFGLAFNVSAATNVRIRIAAGSILFANTTLPLLPGQSLVASWQLAEINTFTGRFEAKERGPTAAGHSFYVVAIPFTWFASGLLPLVIGSLTGFHFRLWHYFAYTSLVALELAYYLHWPA